ncbi:unnamed protein product [Adineta steineri]|uniref:Homeobox domain-containing protein n=1 Tax=Adineta steineri TaxID=433720 RepID=A0A813QXG9_9BILA|nr:unnamed protein product [Adineta steineri]CAF3597744.1 unnamed protein product [Adineta steineri]
MNSTYQPSPLILDPFILHFLSSSIEPPPPLPLSIFFYDPFLVVPPPPITSPTTSDVTTSPPPSQTLLTKSNISARHRYTPLQLFTLHRIFIQLPYPSLEQRRLIAEHLNLDNEQVRIWFSNRRSRQRGSSYQTSLIQPTSNECLNIKPLFDQLNICI